MAKRRKGNRKKRKSNVPRMLSLGPYMPQSIIAKHKYNRIFALAQDYNSVTIGASNLHSFRLNDLHDPDTQATGGPSVAQPRFFDEMANFYTTYRVIGAKVTLKFINLSAEPCYVHTVVGNQQLASGSGWTTKDLSELKNQRRRILHALSSGSKSVASITIPYSPERVEGKSKAVIRGDPNFEATTSQGPLEPHYLSIACSQVSTTLGGQANLNVQVECSIDFTAVWNDRKILANAS